MNTSSSSQLTLQCLQRVGGFRRGLPAHLGDQGLGHEHGRHVAAAAVHGVGIDDHLCVSGDGVQHCVGDEDDRDPPLVRHVGGVNGGLGAGPDGKYHEHAVRIQAQNPVHEEIRFLAQLSGLRVEAADGGLQIVRRHPRGAQSQKMDRRCADHHFHGLLDLLDILWGDDILDRVGCLHPERIDRCWRKDSGSPR